MTISETPQSICRMGVARGDITPPVGIYHRMWGAATHEQATGVHRPLTATVVVFLAADEKSPDVPRQVLIALDHCLLFAREMQSLLTQVSQGTGVAVDQLLVAFSHTHGAGLMDPGRKSLPGGALIEPYLESLAATVVRLVDEAHARVQPATIVYGTGRCTMAGQRDFRDEESGQWVCGFNPEGKADDTVIVARATAGDGKTLATFVNYACHPTTLAFENTLISPDFPGAMCEMIEEWSGAPCVFLQGASGDLGPREGFVGGPALADRNGRQLGYAALAVLETLPPPGTHFKYAGPVVSGATLGIWKHVPVRSEQSAAFEFWRRKQWTVPLSYRPGLPTRETLRADRLRYVSEKQEAEKSGDAVRARDIHALIERIDRQFTRLDSLPDGPEFPFPVLLWRIGGALWLAVEAEHYQWLQQTLRERFPRMPLIVITLANGSRPSYLPTADVYDTGIYQESIALLARGSLEKLVEQISAEIEQMSNP